MIFCSIAEGLDCRRQLEGKVSRYSEGWRIFASRFEKCLTDQKLYEKVVEVRDQASKKFNVSSTPTFFINGQRMSGEKSIEEFDKILAPFLK